MDTSNVFWRILIAVVVAVGLNAVFPAVFRLIGFPVSGDLDLIIRVAIAVGALYYIVKGR